MPLLLDINRKLLQRSDRVKAVDFHPTEPWVLAGLYNGTVLIWNHETGSLVKSFEVTEVPVRCVKFITRKNWFVCGADDFHLRVFNFNTSEKVTAFEAHPDYIRCLAVHPTQSLILTGSDDMTIKLWDWDKSWKAVQVFEGHTHYIMNIAFNPRDSNQFASACLDRTVKVWSLTSGTANFTLDAHDKGVNFVDYYHGGDKPYLVTTGDDRLIKIWDYHSKSCIQTLEGHSSNVSFAIFHPSLPIIISGSEDGTIKIWHANTYRLENTLNYGLERAWCVAYAKKGNDVAFGFDEGAVVVKLGREEPSVSMDAAGKVVYAKNSEVLTCNVSGNQDEQAADGSRIVAPVRELGTTEVYAQTLSHSPNGRFVTVCGDGEYIIYTSLAWRNKSFGTGLSFAWAADSNTYAVRESASRTRVYKNFKERPDLIKRSFGTENVFGGTLLGVKGTSFIVFYDWESGALVRRIEVNARNVSWSGTGNLVCIAAEDSFYVLRFSREAYQNFVDSGQELGDEGVEDAFDVVAEISEVIQTAKWVGDCLVYTTVNNRLNYLVGNQSHTISHFDSQMFLLGYIPSHNRIYLCDKDLAIFVYSLPLAVVEYQTAILRGDHEAANEILPTIPSEQRNRIARFLESQELKELALQVTTDPDHKFELCLGLEDLDSALQICRESPSESKWRTIGDRALQSWRIPLAEECYTAAGDLSSLLLIHTSTGSTSGLESLAQAATTKGSHNIAFISRFLLGDKASCTDILLETDRAPESTLFARTYAPSLVGKPLEAWKTALSAKSKKQADALATPGQQSELFEEGWEEALERERVGRTQHSIGQSAATPASDEEDEQYYEEDERPEPVPQVNGQYLNGFHHDEPPRTPDIILSPPPPAETAQFGTNGIDDDDQRV